MKRTADTRLRILEAASSVAAEKGLANVTIHDVASAAGVSSALVHYHFDTKQALLVAAVERATAEDTDAITQALATGQGLATLDRVWDALLERSGSGRSAFALEVRLHARRDPVLAVALAAGSAAVGEAIGKRLPGLLHELGSRLAASREEIGAAVVVCLDGITLALAGGRSAADVRAAYDAFWLTLIAAGQDARRR